MHLKKLEITYKIEMILRIEGSNGPYNSVKQEKTDQVNFFFKFGKIFFTYVIQVFS